LTAINKKDSAKSELKSLIIVVLFAMIIRIFVIELFFVPTGSMKATILDNDYIFSTKYSYGYSNYSIPFSPNLFNGRIFAASPDRGDIIIMRPPHDMNTRYIKRLIGLPGDKIQIINDVLHINNVSISRQEVGTFIDEKAVEYTKFKEILPNGFSHFTYKLKKPNFILKNERSNFGPYIVPEGHYFFLGDNRDESGDSRGQLGFVPFENLIAKAQFILFSTKEVLWDSNIGIVDQILRVGTWLASIRFNRLLGGMYSQDTGNDK
jgi:signal peptidase I